METKRFDGTDVKAEASGAFEARISTFDKVDKYGDVTRRGCFADTIARWRAKGAMLPVVFAHQSGDIDQHVGEVDPQDLEETSVGLIARGTFYLNEPRAAKVHRQLLRKALTEWSYGFRILRSKATATGRELLALDLFELGPCLCGVGDTQTISVKSETTRPDPHAADRARIELASRRAAFALNVARQL